MALETDAVHGYDIENKLNPSYVGNAIEVGCNNGSGSNAFDVTQTIGFNGSERVDRSAIEAFSSNNANRDVFLRTIYDQFGTKNLLSNLNSVTHSHKIYDGGTQTFQNVDSNGFLVITQPPTGWFGNPDLSTSLTTFSVFIRFRKPSTATAEFAIAGIGGSDAYIGWGLDGGTFSPIGGFGANRRSWYNTTEITTQNAMYDNSIANNDWAILAGTNMVFPDPNPSDFRFGYGRFNNFGEGEISTMIFYNGDKQPELSTKINEINAVNTPVVVASGAVTFNDVTFSNGVVDFFSAPFPSQGAITKVEQVAINSGVATMTIERDPLKNYFGVARGMTQDFTGTLTAVAGTTLSTGLDLTGISIGGANDDHYIFRATGGTGAGTEVTVLSRTGGDITVTDASAFATGTEFTLGRFVRGISRVFPKD